MQKAELIQDLTNLTEHEMYFQIPFSQVVFQWPARQIPEMIFPTIIPSHDDFIHLSGLALNTVIVIRLSRLGKERPSSMSILIGRRFRVSSDIHECTRSERAHSSSSPL